MSNQTTTPLDYQKIIKISSETAEALKVHIDVHDNSPYQVLQLNGQHYNVTEAKTEDIIRFVEMMSGGL